MQTYGSEIVSAMARMIAMIRFSHNLYQCCNSINFLFIYIITIRTTFSKVFQGKTENPKGLQNNLNSLTRLKKNG